MIAFPVIPVTVASSNNVSSVNEVSDSMELTLYHLDVAVLIYSPFTPAVSCVVNNVPEPVTVAEFCVKVKAPVRVLSSMF